MAWVGSSLDVAEHAPGSRNEKHCRPNEGEQQAHSAEHLRGFDDLSAGFQSGCRPVAVDVGADLSSLSGHHSLHEHTFTNL